METIAIALQPYKNTVGLWAAVGKIVLQFFCGVFVVNDIRRNGGSEGFTAGPTLMGAVFSLLNFKFGQILQDDPLMKANLIVLCLNVVYVCAFYWYTVGSAKNEMSRQIGKAVQIVVAVSMLLNTDDPKLFEFRIGLYLTVILLMLVGVPLKELILKKKSTEGLSLPIILSDSFVSFAWLLYGIILRNKFLVLHNLIALALGLVQLSLFLIFPSKPAKKKTESDKKTN